MLRKSLIALAALVGLTGASSLPPSNLTNILAPVPPYGVEISCPAGTSCTALPKMVVMGESSIGDYIPGWVPGGATFNTQNIQAWLNATYVQFVQLNPAQDLQNLARLSCIKAIIPKTNNIYVDSPIIVPPGICTDFRSMIVRKGSAGTITANYTGDTSTQALANLYQPTVIYTPGSHNIGTLEMMLNSNGSDGGSGAAIGRTWSMMTLTKQAGGSGFVGGEVCTVANGDGRAPYSGAQFTVATVSGGAAVTLTYTPSRWDKSGHSGIYPLPIVLQKLLWTTANGWTGSRAVFDGSGNYLTSCSGAGTGLTVSATMYPDWCTGSNGCTSSTTYHGWYSNYSPMFGYYGVVKATQSRNTTDASYGGTFGVLDASYDHRWDEYYSQLANQGIVITGPDCFGNRINTSGNGIGLTFNGGGNCTVPNVVLNNDTQQYLAVDNFGILTLHGSMFEDTSTTPTITGQAIGLGLNTSTATKENWGVNLDFTLSNAGVAGGVPALNCAYTRNSTIRLTVANLYQNAVPFTGQINAWANLGANCASSNVFSGSIDNVSGALFTGNGVNQGARIWDAVAGGFAGGANIYTLSGSGPPTSPTTGQGKADNGSLYTDYANGDTYIQTGTKSTPVWNKQVRLDATGNILAAQLGNAMAGSDNRILNPSFEVDQYQAGAAITPSAAGVYFTNRWFGDSTQNSKITYTPKSSGSSPATEKYYLQIAPASTPTIAATDKFGLVQKIEGNSLWDMGLGTASAQPIQVAVTGKWSIAGPFCIAFHNNGRTRSYVHQISPTATGVWQAMNFTVPGDTAGTWTLADGGYGMELEFDLGAGANFQTTADTWTTGNYTSTAGCVQFVVNAGSFINLTQVRLYPGPIALPSIPRTVAREMLLLSRYYRTSFPLGTKPAQNAGLAGASCTMAPSAASEPSLFVGTYGPQMAGSPTVTTYNPSAANANWRDVTASSDVTVTVDPATAKGPAGFLLSTGATVATLGDALCIHWTASSEL